MKRQEKYKDTNTFHFYNANPHNRFGSDCAIRALATAMEQSWNDTLTGLYEVGLKYGFVPNDIVCINKYLKEKGWTKLPQPRKIDTNKKFTGREFCSVWQHRNMYYEEYSRVVPTNKNIIANLGSGHMVAIIEGKVFDTWDSTLGCVGNIWVKEK